MAHFSVNCNISIACPNDETKHRVRRKMIEAQAQMITANEHLHGMTRIQVLENLLDIFLERQALK